MDPNVELDNQVDDQVAGSEEEELEEDAGSNQASIASKPTVSRSELLRTMVAYATKLGPEELADFVGRIGNADEVTASPDAVYATTQQTTTDDGKNKASINSASAPAMPMPSVKEDLALVFGSEDLTEDFKARAEALFEAAVATRVDLEKARLEEQFENELQEQVEQITEELAENVDAYLDYAVAQWINENRLAIETGIRAEIAESFINGLKGLFDEHYVDIPEEKVDVVESLASTVEQLEAGLAEATELNQQLVKKLHESAVAQIKESLSADLTDVQKEKFAKLVDVIEYNDVEEFSKKASIIKETYYKNGAAESNSRTADVLLNESVDEPPASPTAGLAPDIASYVSSISKIAKK